MTFMSDINVRRKPGSNKKWVLSERLTYVGCRDQFIVPIGFPTDFASIPWFLHSLFPKNGSHDAAAIIHDYLYARHPIVKNYTMMGVRRITRKEADQLFLKIMKELETPPLRRNLMYLAVRVFGRRGWRRWQV